MRAILHGDQRSAARGRGHLKLFSHLLERQLLLVCCRDNTIRLIDLRTKSVVDTFTADGFNVSLDWSRACFRLVIKKLMAK